MRFKLRRNVDLPQPDGPMSAQDLAGAELQRRIVQSVVVAVVDVHVTRGKDRLPVFLLTHSAVILFARALPATREPR